MISLGLNGAALTPGVGFVLPVGPGPGSGPAKTGSGAALGGPRFPDLCLRGTVLVAPPLSGAGDFLPDAVFGRAPPRLGVGDTSRFGGAGAGTGACDRFLSCRHDEVAAEEEDEEVRDADGDFRLDHARFGVVIVGVLPVDLGDDRTLLWLDRDKTREAMLSSSGVPPSLPA